jgi:hypothetical protein
MNIQMNEPHGIVVCDCNPPNHLLDFEEGIMIRALFSWGQFEPCVYEEGGLKKDLEEFYGI